MQGDELADEPLIWRCSRDVGVCYSWCRIVLEVTLERGERAVTWWCCRGVVAVLVGLLCCCVVCCLVRFLFVCSFVVLFVFFRGVFRYLPFPFYVSFTRTFSGYFRGDARLRVLRSPWGRDIVSAGVTPWVVPGPWVSRRGYPRPSIRAATSRRCSSSGPRLRVPGHASDLHRGHRKPCPSGTGSCLA